MNGHVGDAITALRDQLKNISSNQREKENQRESPSAERRTMNETRSRTLPEQSLCLQTAEHD